MAPFARPKRICSIATVLILVAVAVLVCFQFQALTRVNNNYTTKVNDVVMMDEIRNPKSSAAALRSKRLKMYLERYNYQLPGSYTEHAQREELCGTGPNFDVFFSKNHKERSRLSEDLTIYNIFFKPDSDDGVDAKPPIKGSIVELGAFDGKIESNSRFYDVCLGWDALLIEANPLTFEKLTRNRPHAHRFNFAPSCNEQEESAGKMIRFDWYPMTNAGLADGTVKTAYTDKNKTVDVPCGSLTKVLTDVFPTGHVTFFSLDVEGAENHVLSNIDFDQVFVEILMVESANNFCGAKCESRDQFRQTMSDKDYVNFQRMISHSDVFVHTLSDHLETARRYAKLNTEIKVIEKST